MKRKIIVSIKWLFNQLGLELERSKRLKDRIKRGEYDWLRSLGIKTVFDVGANDGEFAKYINVIYPEAKIYSFEPLRETFLKLKNNTTHIKNIEHYNCGLGDCEGEALINHNQFSPSSSILQITNAHTDAFPYTKNTFQEKIVIKTIDQLTGQLNIVHNALLKIDVQGYEMNVLKGAVTTLKNIDVVIIETSFVELYKSQPLFDEIYEYMKKNGFTFRGNIGQLLSPVDGEILQADSIFIRNEIIPVKNV